MNLYCIKYLVFTKNNDIKIKHKIDGKINLHSRCIVPRCTAVLKNLQLLMKKN